jgi:hypothetical protein
MLGIKHTFYLALALSTISLGACNPFADTNHTTPAVTSDAGKPFSISLGVETQFQEASGAWSTSSTASYGFLSDENDSVAIDFPATVTVVSKDGVNFNVTFDEQGDKCGIHGLVAYVAVDESINTSYVSNNCGRTRMVVGVAPR